MTFLSSERRQGDEPGANPVQLAHIVRERLLGPPSLSMAHRRVGASVIAAHEVRELQPHGSLLIAGTAVFVFFSRVAPAVRFEQRRDPGKVVEPDRHVEIVVSSRDRAGIEVDRPSAEQPVVDALLAEEVSHPRERNEAAAMPADPRVSS